MSLVIGVLRDFCCGMYYLCGLLTDCCSAPLVVFDWFGVGAMLFWLWIW